MALPTELAGAQFTGRNYYCGPFLSGGNVYVVVKQAAAPSNLVVWKATDPTSSFSIQDAANEPATTAVVNTWVYQDGTDLHMVTSSFNGDGGNGIVWYHRFSMSSDTWTETDTTVEGGIKGQTIASNSVSIAVRSDGDRIVLYGGDPDTDMGTEFDRVDYALWEGVSWTVGIDVGGISPANHARRGASVVLGTNDGMHFYWGRNGVAEARTLNSANSLSTTVSASLSMADHYPRNGFSYDDAGTQRMSVPVARTDITDMQVLTSSEDGSDNVQSLSVVTVSSVNDVSIANGTPIASCALDGTTLHVLWSSAADNDLYRDSAAAPHTSYGTDIEFLDAVTINRISVNIYDRGGTKLAMVYDNGGTIQYNEISLAVEGRPPLVRLPRHAPFRAAFY